VNVRFSESWKTASRWVAIWVFLFFGLGVSRVDAATLLTEGFNNVATLVGSGWVLTNNSSPIGTTGWFQGNDAVFPSQAGASNAYIAANFNNAAFGGNISNWLLTPVLALNNGTSLSFWTRTADVTSGFPDRLEVRLSINGASSNVGVTDSSVGDFTTLLLTVNPTLTAGGYPDGWTNFVATVSGLGGPASGRFGFRYNVGNTAINSDYIGVDTVSVESKESVPAVPEPSSLLTAGLGLLLVVGGRRFLSPKSDELQNRSMEAS